MNVLKICCKLLSFWGIVVYLCISCTKQTKKKINLQEKKTYQNYATFIRDSVVYVKKIQHSAKEIVWETEIILINTSKHQIFINDILTGCGCIKYEFSKKPFTYNETSKLRFRYSIKASESYFNKNSLILLNNGRYFFCVNLKKE